MKRIIDAAIRISGFDSGGLVNYSADDQPHGVTKSAPPWHAKLWCHLKNGSQAYVEWSLGEKTCGVSLRLSPHDEHVVKVHVAVPSVALFTGYAPKHGAFVHRMIEAIAGGPTDIHDKYGSRELSLRVHDWALWWDVWVDPTGWSSKRPKWRDGSFHVLDALFGKHEYESIPLKTATIQIPMPEGLYKGTCTLSEDVWKRPRWFAKKIRRAHVDMVEPIPFPGKGSESWNCGDDAAFGMTMQARTIGDAIGAMVASVTNSRHRNGGPNWRPEPAAIGEEKR